MAEEFNNEELEFTPEVVQEEVTPIVAEEPVEAPAPVAEEPVVVEEAPAPAPKKKVKKSAPKVEKKAPGMYHDGRLITAIPARLGKKWTVVVDGKREKVLRKDIEIVK